MPNYTQDMTATSGNMGGDKKKKRKDKKAHARSVSGGPKVMRKETLVSYKPNTDDNENKGRGGKGPKPMSKTRRAKASVMKLKDGLVSRFQGSTPKVGKNRLMEPVMKELTYPVKIYPVAEAGLTGYRAYENPNEKNKSKKKK